MAHSARPNHDAAQCVTASDLVRQFGVWQERAARAPVYVLHRGRPRLVLTSVDLMNTLCAPFALATGPGDAALAVLLDSRDEIALVLDAQGAIAIASRAARAGFGDIVAPGASPIAIADLGGEMLGDAIDRVLSTGLAESIEIVPRRFADRHLLCMIEPLPVGCLIRCADLSAEQSLSDVLARDVALRTAAEVAGAITVRVSVRGHLMEAPTSLSRLTGIGADALSTARLVSLFDVAGRVAIGEAIEQTATTAQPQRVGGQLLVRGGTPRSAAIGLAATRVGGRIDELIATIVPDAA